MTQQQIHELFKQSYNRANWKHFLGETFANARLLSTPEVLNGFDGNVASNALKLGYILLNEDGIERQIAVYEVTLAQGIILERNRVGLRNVLRKYWKDIDAAFIVYHQPESPKWRFSYVSELTGYDAEGEFIKIKTEPKRYTYVLGEGESTRTASERFSIVAAKGSKATLDDVKEAFSVEKLSKAFFDEYKNHYDIFCDFMVSKPYIRQTIFDGDEKAIRDFNKKLLGRIVFLYFIQKKGWLGVPLKSEWGKGDFNFLTKQFEHFRNKDLFYTEFLSTLFFDTLNSKRDGDLIELVKGEPCRIPFLNGGLFEEDDKKHRNLILPAELFQNLFGFFNQYNFTIYEDDPNDHTVAVDPEMLGHIFENLLEDNKDKGAFYTPKEIVHYMCQESLIEYLTTWFENKGYEIKGYSEFGNTQPQLFPVNEGRKGQLVLEADTKRKGKQIDRLLIEKLLKKKLTDDDKRLVLEHSDEFHQALDQVKICDPAIGSGAFPMGLLHEIFTAKQILHSFKFGNAKDFDASSVKLNIIQNSIYGVDIEKGAVDIARLRFWLSLIVDESEPKALPNLDYKIVAGNSLVSKLIIDDDWQYIDIDWSKRKTVGKAEEFRKKLATSISQLSEKQKNYFINENKSRLREEIRELKIDILINQLSYNREQYIENNSAKSDLGFGLKPNEIIKNLEIISTVKEYDKSICSLQKIKNDPSLTFQFFDWKLDFPEVMNEQVNTEAGFDIVIGNPPYINVELMEKEIKEIFKRKFDTFFKRSDIFSLFIDYSITKLSKKDGHLAFIVPSIVLNNLSYKPLRDKLLVNRWISQICYTGNKIFEEATVDTVILLLDKKGVNEISLIDALDFNHPRSSKVFADYFSKFNNILSVSNDSNSNNIFDKLFHPDNINIESHFDVFQGIVTGNNPVFIFDEPEQWQALNIESDLLQTVIHGRDFNKWIIKNTDRKILYLCPKSNIDDYPEARKYILQFKSELIKRRECKNGVIPWFSLQWARNRELLNITPKIIIQNTRNERLHPRIVATVDEIGIYGSQGLNFVVPKTNIYSVYFLIGIINSKLINYLFATKFLNLAIKADYIKQISFPKPSPSFIFQIENLTKKILADKLKKSITKLEFDVDTLVYRLYNLSYNEVKIIDPEFELNETEYNAIN